MKLFNSALILSLVLGAPLMANAGPARPGMEKPVSKEVDAYSKALKASGLTGKIEGLKALSEVRPSINNVLEKISKEISKAKAQKNITENKAQFDTLTENINAASAQAAEMRASGAKFEGSAEKVLEGIESLPGMLLEVANAGPKADMSKAQDVARMFAEVTAKDLSNEVDASVVRAKIEQRLGTDKEGKQITLEDLIKRCLGA